MAEASLPPHRPEEDDARPGLGLFDESGYEKLTVREGPTPKTRLVATAVLARFVA
jgi:hypothetical protein